MLSLVLLAVSAGAVVSRADYSLAGEWGELGSADGQFRRPTGIDVDQAGNVYVADMLNGRIQKFDSSGALMAAWGGIGVNDGQFDELIDVDVDFAGNVYALDIRGNTVQRFDGAGGFVTSWPAKRPDLNVLTSITVGGIDRKSTRLNSSH